MLKPEEEAKGRVFFDQAIADLNCVIPAEDYDEIVWHYTTGQSLIEIVRTGSLFATQVACLNDTTELRYAVSLFRQELEKLLPRPSLSTRELTFLQRYLSLIEFEQDGPTIAPSKFFVSCFSESRDDLSQWRCYGGGENAYAIGIRKGHLFGIPNCLTLRVNYSKPDHEKLAASAARTTLEMFREGLNLRPGNSSDGWEDTFLEYWDDALMLLAPMVKDPGFAAECEIRNLYTLMETDFPRLKFLQRSSLMSRHLPLTYPAGGGDAPNFRLPITEIVVGPCRHREISRISVGTLLKTYGYQGTLVTMSQRPFQQM